MVIACHYAIPRPPVPALDAAVQDGIALVQRLDGVINFLYPGSRTRRLIPRFLCGFHQIPYLLRLDRQVELHQVFSNGIYPYPVLGLLAKPIVYTSVVRVCSVPALPARILLRNVRCVVASREDRAVLQHAGFSADVILPGIDVNRFSASRPPTGDGFVLLAGSAPWNEEQFASKGVDLLLQAARRLPWLRLVFLWRGRLLSEMEARIVRHSLADQVTVISQRVDVNHVLAQVHAAIVLAGQPDIVKAYPHSLLEALAAARPVLLSRCLPMAGFVRRAGCGVLVDDLRLPVLIKSLSIMRERYSCFAAAATRVDMNMFSKKNMVSAYLRLYGRVVGRDAGEIGGPAPPGQ